MYHHFTCTAVAIAAILWNKALPIQLRIGQYQKFLVAMSTKMS